ncbi:thiamine diphosphokinase [Pseudoroseicyclus aestuarii]|uniref:Thiamine diphosphokinase n=1 Tax=Pseudoroseicyclus aestuarii TaxID=1795041 RepID=A0A318SSX8_9RHOB|nr:thiamine diphosphokinase [Pseudoroseicyclus aestuarii]PYE81227.1 thiamine pyrophosphokinase [Pseudoroseicyclus aestuarii]
MAIVQTSKYVTLVGGGPVDPAALHRSLRLAPALAAADGGAAPLRQADLRPLAVIGDMDSLGAAERAAFEGLLHHIPEQETTDFDKALRSVAAPLVLGLGFLGGRLDHELAALTVLARHAHRACLLLGAESLVFLCPPQIALDLPEGTPLSLYPLAPVGCESSGLRWPTAGLTFAPDGQVGTSNAVTGPVRLAPTGPSMLVMLPESLLERVLPALAAAPRWPARAQ